MADDTLTAEKLIELAKGLPLAPRLILAHWLTGPVYFRSRGEDGREEWRMTPESWHTFTKCVAAPGPMPDPYGLFGMGVEHEDHPPTLAMIQVLRDPDCRKHLRYPVNEDWLPSEWKVRGA